MSVLKSFRIAQFRHTIQALRIGNSRCKSARTILIDILPGAGAHCTSFVFQLPDSNDIFCWIETWVYWVEECPPSLFSLNAFPLTILQVSALRTLFLTQPHSLPPPGPPTIFPRLCNPLLFISPYLCDLKPTCEDCSDVLGLSGAMVGGCSLAPAEPLAPKARGCTCRMCGNPAAL